MARNFQEVGRFLQAHYPDLEGRIKGENYPVPEAAMIAASFVKYLQMFALVATFFGDAIWSYIPFVRGPPSWYYGMKESGMAMPALVCLFLNVPTVVQSYQTTGAFEIIVDGAVIFSKLEIGRMPNGDDLVRGMATLGMKSVLI